MFTGSDIYKTFLQGIGQDWSGSYSNPVKAQRLLDKSFNLLVEQKYNKDDQQKTRDDLSFLVSTDNVYNLNNNQIYIVPLQISNVVIVATTAIITTVLPHNILSGQTVTTAGISGFTVNPNGSFVATVTSPTTFTITVTATTGAYTHETGTVTYSNMISDYWHYLSSDAQYSVPIVDFSIKNMTGNGVPIIITLNKYGNNISTGEQITIANATGNTAANGTFYVFKQNELTMALYYDADLQNPVIGNGTYMGNATMTRTYYNTAKPYIINERISKINEPTPQDPKYYPSNLMIKYYPLPPVICTQITIDYLRQPLVKMDLTDGVTDLNGYYPQIFINEIIAEMMKLGAAELRDDEEVQLATNLKQDTDAA